MNSSPWKRIIDTGCTKMVMGSDTFKQYLDLLTPFQVRRQRDEDVTLVRGHPDEHWEACVS